MALSEEEALSLREGDVVLAPMLVRSTNNHFDKGVGVSLSCMVPTTTGVRELPTNEFRSGKEYLAGIASSLVHSVHKKVIREGDWVKYPGPFDPVGKVKSVIGAEAVVRKRFTQDDESKHAVFPISKLARISAPQDLTDAEKKALAA